MVLHQYKTLEGIETKIPTEVLISDRREFELAECGFIGLTMYKNTDKACFFSANSVQKPKTFRRHGGRVRRDQTNYKLGTRLPYMMMVSRLAHYLKVIQRDNIQTWQTPTKMQTELVEWMRQYSADYGQPDRPRSPPAGPSESFKIDVAEVPGEVGFYKGGSPGHAAHQVRGRQLHALTSRQAGQAIARGATAKATSDGSQDLGTDPGGALGTGGVSDRLHQLPGR